MRSRTNGGRDSSKSAMAVVKLLLEKGADLFNWTPLSYAANNGHEAIVKLLLDEGADYEAKYNSGWRPLSWAEINGHEAIVKLLLKKGARRQPGFPGRRQVWPDVAIVCS